MIQSLLDAINNGKTSGEKQAIELKYNILNLDSILINHPTIENVTIIPNTSMSKENFELEVLNAFKQWEMFLNKIYGNYITLQFVQSSDSPDITIEFDASIVSLSSVTGSKIKLNLGINWRTIVGGRGIVVLNYLVRDIGFVFSIGETMVLSPMNSSYIGMNFVLANGIPILEDGSIQSCFLVLYPSVKNIVISVYGVSVAPIPLILGCTNPNASNYNPEATLDDLSCLLEPVNVSSPRSVEYLLNPTEYFLANDYTVYPYSLGLFDVEQPYSLDTSFSNLITGDSMITSLVITDKSASLYGNSTGEIRYYTLISDDDTLVFNKNGDLLSNLQAYQASNFASSLFLSSTINAADGSVHLWSFNIIYGLDGADNNKHVLDYIQHGYAKKITLDDSMHQFNSQGDIIAACDLDTYAYGNLLEYNTTSVGHSIKNADGSPLTISNGLLNVALVPVFSKLLLQDPNNPAGSSYQYQSGYSDDLAGGHGNSFNPYTIDTSILNLKSFYIPTVAGLKVGVIDLESNFLKITHIGSSDQINNNFAPKPFCPPSIFSSSLS